MENKHVGWIIMGISILIILLVLLFNNALMESVRNSCFIQHGDIKSCEMYDSVNYQTYLALGIVGVLIIFGLFLIFSKPSEKLIIKTKTIEKKKPERKYDLSDLKPEEKKVFELIKENKTIFQADLIEKTEFGKAKMTRIIDRLEGRGMVERKRRGMTNVVVLKE